jgi:hypothetical protein
MDEVGRMKTFYRYWVLLLLLGCGAEAPRQPDQRICYPALNESPPPPQPFPPQPPPQAEAPSALLSKPSDKPPSTITGDRWLERKDEKEAVLKRLREYSAKAAPDDPFALTEAQIIELSKREDIRFN